MFVFCFCGRPHFPLARALSLSHSVCRRVDCFVFLKLTAQLEFFRQCELRCRCHRVASQRQRQRIVLCLCVCKESVREQQSEEYFSSCFSMKMPYGSSSYATVGGETEAATQTVLIYAKM